MSDYGTFAVDLEDAENREQTLARATKQLMQLADKVLNKPPPIPRPRLSKANKYIKTLQVVRDVFLKTDENVEQIYKVHVFKTNPGLINQMIAHKTRSEKQEEIKETQGRKSSTRESTSESQESRSSTRKSGSFTPISSNLTQKESWETKMREMTTPNTTAQNSIRSERTSSSSSSKIDLRTAGKPHMINMQHLMKKIGKSKKKMGKSGKQKNKGSQKSSKSKEIHKEGKSPVSFKTFVKRDMQNEPVSLKSMDNITVGKCHPHLVKGQNSKEYNVMIDKEIYPTQTPSQKTSMTWWNSSEENTCCQDLNMESTQKLDTPIVKLTSDEEMDKTQIKTPPKKKKQKKRSKKMENTQISSATSLIDESFPMEKSGNSIASTKKLSSSNFEFMERTQTSTPKSNKNTTKYIEDPMEKTQNKSTRSEKKERIKREKSERNMNPTQIQTPKSNLPKIENTTPKSKTQSKSARSAIQKTQSLTPTNFIETKMDKTQPMSFQSEFQSDETQLSTARENLETTQKLMDNSSIENTQTLSRKSTRESLPTPRLGYSMDWTQITEPIKIEWTESETLMEKTQTPREVSSIEPFEISDFEESMEKTQNTSPRSLMEKKILSVEESLENTQVSSKIKERPKKKTRDKSDKMSIKSSKTPSEENAQESPSSENKYSLRISRHEILTLNKEELEKITDEIFTSPENTNTSMDDTQRENEEEFYRNIGLALETPESKGENIPARNKTHIAEMRIETPEYDITEDETSSSLMDLTQSERKVRGQLSSHTNSTNSGQISMGETPSETKYALVLSKDETADSLMDLTQRSVREQLSSKTYTTHNISMEDTQREESQETCVVSNNKTITPNESPQTTPIIHMCVEDLSIRENSDRNDTTLDFIEGKPSIMDSTLVFGHDNKPESQEIPGNMEDTQREENEEIEEPGKVCEMEKFSYTKLDGDEFEKENKAENVAEADRKSGDIIDMENTQREETPEYATSINHTSTSDAKIATSMPVLGIDAWKCLSASGSMEMGDTQRENMTTSSTEISTVQTNSSSWETVETVKTVTEITQSEENLAQHISSLENAIPELPYLKMAKPLELNNESPVSPPILNECVLDLSIREDKSVKMDDTQYSLDFNEGPPTFMDSTQISEKVTKFSVNMEETQREEINSGAYEIGKGSKMEKFSYEKLDGDGFEKKLKPTKVEGTKQNVADRKSSTVSDVSLDMEDTQRDKTPEYSININHKSSSDAKIAASTPVIGKDAWNKWLSTSVSESMEETQRQILSSENKSTASLETIDTNMESTQKEENLVESGEQNKNPQMNYCAVTYNLTIEHDGKGEATCLSGDTLPYQVFINGSPFINRRL